MAMGAIPELFVMSHCLMARDAMLHLLVEEMITINVNLSGRSRTDVVAPKGTSVRGSGSFVSSTYRNTNLSPSPPSPVSVGLAKAAKRVCPMGFRGGGIEGSIFASARLFLSVTRAHRSVLTADIHLHAEEITS
jgi:hypothetical protein